MGIFYNGYGIFLHDVTDVKHREQIYEGNPRSRYGRWTAPNVNPAELHPYMKPNGWAGTVYGNPTRFERIQTCIHDNTTQHYNDLCDNRELDFIGSLMGGYMCYMLYEYKFFVRPKFWRTLPFTQGYPHGTINPMTGELVTTKHLIGKIPYQHSDSDHR